MRKSVFKDQPSNIKVVCRFRPLIDIELELSQSDEIYSFPNTQSVLTKQGESFTYDRVFVQSASQSEIFDFIGRPIVEDVLTGYNGTVLAYGQTGSGKSFSMMGVDIYSDSEMGLIPRAIKQVFESMEVSNTETEYTLKCSMLEIYKEKLKDLCGFSSELKIKESKSRGVYVDGLTEIYVTNEAEMFEVLALGEQNRTVGSTRMNKVSSRSHQLFILEVRQKLPNDSEKKGILNLVDLAGSEKITQTGATGEKLEEAKKINLSLSALGNVINSLTKKSEHVPYRDSKLTRILQESLGGNYKTTLIVCCSPHPRNYDDTINSLKFAQRAKTIKNKARLNIKKSAEEYLKIIEELRNQLAEATKEIEFWKLKSCHDNSKKRSHSVKTFEIRGLIPEVTAEDPNEDRSDSSLELKPQETGKEEVLALRSEVEDLKEKNKEISDELMRETNKRIAAEKKYNDYFDLYNKVVLSVNEKNYRQEYLTEENTSLYGQISALKNHIRLMNKKYSEVVQKVKEGANIMEWEFSDNYEEAKILPVFTLDKVLEVDEQKPESLIGITVDPNKLVEEDLYAQELALAIEESSALNLHLIIFELKKQIINSGLVNCELYRNYSDLKLRETLLTEKFNLKLRQSKFLLYKLGLYEKIIENLQSSYNKVLRVVESDIDRSQDTQKKTAKIVRPFKQAPDSHERSLRRTTTSVMPQGLLRRQATLSSEFDKSSFKQSVLDSSYQVQQMYNSQLKLELEVVNAEKDSYKKLYSDLQAESINVFLKEKRRWKNFIDKFKLNCDKELMRRQAEISQLNQQIGHWMHMYLELQQTSGMKTVGKTAGQKKHNRTQSFLGRDTVRISVYNSPLHTEFRQSKLSNISSRRGDESPLE